MYAVSTRARRVSFEATSSPHFNCNLTIFGGSDRRRIYRSPQSLSILGPEEQNYEQLFLFHPPPSSFPTYRLLSLLFFQLHEARYFSLPFVFLVIPAHLYFVSCRMSGIDRETQEEARIILLFSLPNHCTTLALLVSFFFNFFLYFFLYLPDPFPPLDSPLFFPLFLKRNAKGRPVDATQ